MSNGIATIVRMHLDKAHALAFAELERRARRILETHRSLNGFVCCMGSAFFVGPHGPVDIDSLAYLKPVRDLLDAFDNELHLTGTPVRIDRDETGALIRTTDW
jgi:hypothetical protein